MCAMEGIEDRKYQRFEIPLVAAVNGLHGRPPGKGNYFVVKNLCGSGAFFLSDERPGIDSQLLAELSLPKHGLRLTIEGKSYYGKLRGYVVRHGTDGFAVSFDDEYNIDYWA